MKSKTNVVPFVRPDEPRPPSPAPVDEPQALVLEQQHKRPLAMAMAFGAIQGAVAFIEDLKQSRSPKRMKRASRRQETVSAEFMDEKELCATLGIAAVTATKWRAKAEGPPFVKLGRLIRYRRSEVEVWLASNRRGTGPVD